MMLVENYIDKSPIHGLGIYARDFIPKGTRVWEFTRGCDRVFTEAELAALLPVQRDIIMFYCYVELGRQGVVLCCDNARHFNYSRDFNCGPGDHAVDGYVSTFALRDIAAGEELTFSIEEDEDAMRKLGGPPKA